MKSGRRRKKDDREKLVHVGFRADEETVEAIRKLTAAATRPGVVSPKSVAIRRALIDAAARLGVVSPKNG